MIGSTLTKEGRNKLCGLLQRNLDIFSWKPADMTDIPRHIAEHRLNVREGCSSVRQNKRGQAADRNQAIQEEVKKLVEAGIMKEVHNHDWLSNPMMVKKHDDSWRMCIYFKDLNKACPKDGYPLPEIDWKVESLCGFPFKCFMPFGLRNVGATYQRLVDKAFHKQIGRNLEVYVDDLVIKSHTEDEIGRRRDVLRIQSQHQGAESLSRQGRRCPKSSIPKMLERRTKVKQKSRKPEQGIKRSRNKLYINGKVSVGLGVIKTGSSREAIEMEHELGEYAIHYRARVLVKGQILADFIVERPEEESPDTLIEVEEELPEPWILFTDGSSCTDGSGAGLILTNPEEIQVPRSENKKADALSKIASTSFAHLSKQVLVEELKENSICEVEILSVVEEEGDTWMTPIFEYLTEETLPTDAKKARADNPFKDWCEKLCIRQHFASVKHPQTNGLVERANRSLGEGIKARLDVRSKNWMEKLSHVLWAHRTMIKSSNGDTPFLLTYGTKAVIPAEIGMPTLRTTEMDLVQNNEALEINLDLLEERREQAVIREENRKLGPKWEGPYEVTEALGKGAYKLRDRDGRQLPRTWNIRNLKKCYIHKI
ncbi:reverse transcriptase domain-containing protein [Tanacetum coccineum]